VVDLKLIAVLALCVLSLQILTFGQAEVSDAAYSNLPLLLRPNLRMDPGAVVVVGRNAAQSDVVASAFTRLGIQSWIGDSTKRIAFVRPDLKLNIAGINGIALNSLKVCNVDLESAKALDQGLFMISVGGPEANLTTRKINAELPVRFLKNYNLGGWTVATLTEGIPEYYPGDEYGIIAFVPEQLHLNGDTFYNLTNGHRQLGTLVVAGNSREGTLAAAMCLRDILNGSNVEGRKLLYEMDKVLIWMISGEPQRLHSIVVMVKLAGEDTTEIVDVFFF